MASKFGRWVFGALAFGAAMVAAPRAADAALVGFCDFSNAGQVQGLTLNGSAQAPAGVLYLTPNGNGDTGSAYLTTPVNLTSTTSFKTHFRFRMYPNTTGATGGSGIAFVMQNKSPTALGGAGSKLGINGVNPSVAVEFDAAKDENSDPNDNHVGIVVDGNTGNHLATATPPFNMKNGTITDAWVDYDAPTTTLRVYIAQNAPKPATALLTRVINIYTTVDALGAGNKMWIGFSASAGQQVNNYQDVAYWVFANDGTPLTDCVTCTNDSQCVVTPTTPVCNNDPGVCSGGTGDPCFCVQCTPQNQTQCTGQTPVCDAATNTCVECNTDAQCGGNKPVCQNHICVPCQNDLGGAPPACSNPTTPVCQKVTDPIPGACTECSASNATQCTGDTPVCIPATGTCGCTMDSECGPANGGVICDQGVCNPGCRPDGTVTCPAGGNCQDNGNNQGTCVTGCADNTQCAAPTPICDPNSNNCVQCTTNADCTGNEVCTPQNTCAECTPTNTTNCDPNGTGGACRPNGQCGCATDADCGGVNSGRVCDDTNKVCRAGCRGTGGNKCPTELRCTSTTNAIGQCVTDPGTQPDGGPDAGGPDAGPGTDAGPKFDGGTTGDGGGADAALPLDEISIEGGGCNCSVVPGGGAVPAGAFAGAALGVLAMVRRRRTKR